MSIDFDSINARLLSDYLGTLKQWLPNGKKIGPNWCVGSLAGEPGDSLKIHVRKGIWADFATGEKGSDPVSLYAALHGIGQGEAAKRLGGTTQQVPVKKSPEPTEIELDPVLNPPEDMPDPKLPACSARYTYRNAAGNVLGFICRIDDGKGGKKLIPRTPWYDERGDIVWQSKGFPCPRPLYGLNVLASLPVAVVVLVEGEKCADALQACIPTTPTLAWPGGSNAIEHVDWEPLRGRQVILWPDADEPGRKAMARVAEILIARGCQVKIATPPADASKGWDVADAIAEGWTPNQCAEFLGKAERVGSEMVIARTTTTTQAIRTADAELVQRVEVREELAESKPVLEDYGFQRGAQGRYVPSLDGVCRVLEKHPRWAGKIWYDTFLEKVQTDAFGPTENWTDYLAARLNRWIQAVFEFPTLGTERVQEAADTVARGNPRNVLREWLESLTWDQTPRLHDLLPRGFGTRQDIYHVRVGECWLVSMVARALQPGCKVDTMPVFEGSQGAGKSSALAILGGEWFGECHEDFGSKDFVLSLKGCWLIEVAEMHAFRRADVDRLKGIMSTRIDRVRVPYGRVTEEHPRQSVFAGTTNRDDWQADDTGARRFWPVRCGFLNHDWLRENREQLFAEAVARFRAGDDWWSVPTVQAADAADERRPEDPWEEVIAGYVDINRTYSARELLGTPLNIDIENQSNAAAKRVGSILRRLGWTSYVSHNGTATKRWRCEPVRTDANR
jgi:hypothetical protein